MRDRDSVKEMICKKCGHDVDKYEVIYIFDSKRCHKINGVMCKGFDVPYCPCGEKL